MKTKHGDSLFLMFILALPFSWANVGSMSIYRLVTIVAFAYWLFRKRLQIPVPRDDRRHLYFAWLTYAAYSVLAFVLYPANTNVVFGMLLLVLISFIFFSSSIGSELSKYTDYIWLVVAYFFIILFVFGRSSQVGEWGTRQTLVILGTKTDANEFSSFFIVALPIALSIILNEKGVAKRVFCTIALIGGLYVVLMGGSRAALLSVVVALAITVCMALKPSPKVIGMILFAGVVLLIAIPRFILPLIPQDTLSRLSIEALMSDSGSGRSDIWTTALKEFGDKNPLNWLFGCGYGGLTISYFVGDTSTMHNQLLQQLVSYGIIGLYLYLRLVFLAYKAIKEKCKRYVGAFIGIMLMSLTLTMGPSYKILWILIFMAGMRRDVNEVQ